MREPPSRRSTNRLSSRWSATARATWVRGESPNPDEIGHTLRTAIVDRDGTVVKIYTGNEWTPAEIVGELQKLR